MRDRLIELITDIAAGMVAICGDCCDDCKHGNCEGKLADHLLANGVVVLPCKIGEKLYDCGEFFLEGCSCPEIYELKDDEMTIHKIPHEYGYRFTYDSFYISHDDIGNHIFRTKEEAEQALKNNKGE